MQHMAFNGTHWAQMPNRDEILERMRLKKIGMKQSAETIEKRVSKFRGRVSPMFGRKHTEEAKRRIGMALKGRMPKHFAEFQKRAWEANRKRREELSSNWKGDTVGYTGLHAWVRRQLGTPKECEHCDKDGLVGRKIHWASKSGEYKRDVDDWIRLCASCHSKYDKIFLRRQRDSAGRFH